MIIIIFLKIKSCFVHIIPHVLHHLNQQNNRTLLITNTQSIFTLRAIFSLMVELGPEFLREKHWVSVMSSSTRRLLKGTVKLPSVHLCLSSLTCVLRKKKDQPVSSSPPRRKRVLMKNTCCHESFCRITSTSSSCLLGLWTRNEKQSSHRGSLVL